MICEHCGSKVVDGGHACLVCGMSPIAPKQTSRGSGKVVPFRTKRKGSEHPLVPKAPIPRKRKFSAAWWWIVGIVVIALIIPYILPLR